MNKKQYKNYTKHEACNEDVIKEKGLICNDDGRKQKGFDHTVSPLKNTISMKRA